MKNRVNVFAAQSDREKSEGLPVAPFMDREKVTKPTAQIGFIKFVLIPMFETVMKVSLFWKQVFNHHSAAAHCRATSTNMLLLRS